MYSKIKEIHLGGELILPDFSKIKISTNKFIYQIFDNPICSKDTGQLKRDKIKPIVKKGYEMKCVEGNANYHMYERQ